MKPRVRLQDEAVRIQRPRPTDTIRYEYKIILISTEFPEEFLFSRPRKKGVVVLFSGGLRGLIFHCKPVRIRQRDSERGTYEDQ